MLQSLPGDFLRIGFAAETNNHLENARSKLLAKELDALVVNDVAGSDRGFAAETNAVTILRPDRPNLEIPLTSKADVAAAVLEVVVELIGGSLTRSAARLAGWGADRLAGGMAFPRASVGAGRAGD